MELLRILAFVNMSKMVLGNSDTGFFWVAFSTLALSVVINYNCG